MAWRVWPTDGVASYYHEDFRGLNYLPAMKEKVFKSYISSDTKVKKWRFMNFVVKSPPRYWH